MSELKIYLVFIAVLVQKCFMSSNLNVVRFYTLWEGGTYLFYSVEHEEGARQDIVVAGSLIFSTTITNLLILIITNLISKYVHTPHFSHNA